MNQIALLKNEFAKQAKNFNDPDHTIGNESIMRWILDSLEVNKKFDVLDAAAGTALVGRALAPHVNSVIALDATPEMLNEGRSSAQAQNISNISFQEGRVESIPFEDAKFDLIISRLAFHHFNEPKKPLQEMIRIAKAKGSVVIIDLISPDQEELAEQYNHIERLRDPSHTQALRIDEFGALFDSLDLQGSLVSSREIVVDFEKWVQLTKTPQPVIREIRSLLTAEIENKETLTGMRPYQSNGSLKFIQTWVILKILSLKTSGRS